MENINDKIVIATSDYEKFKSILVEMRKGPSENDETPASVACSLFADRLEGAINPLEVHSYMDGMQEFRPIGNIFAKPMKRIDGFGVLGWGVPLDRDPEDEGYLVVFRMGESDQTTCWYCKSAFESLFARRTN